MRAFAKAEYACIAMLELALHHADKTPLRIKTIAEAHGIPQNFLVHILLQLKNAGLVESIRGSSGGYLLARPPVEISIADVIRTIDYPDPRLESVASAESSAVKSVRSVWREAQAEAQRVFERLDLAELLRRTQETNELTYQI